jgi:hypothetical protein
VLTSHGIRIQIMLIRLRMLLRRLRLRFISRHADLLWLPYAAISPDVILLKGLSAHPGTLNIITWRDSSKGVVHKVVTPLPQDDRPYINRDPW